MRVHKIFALSSLRRLSAALAAAVVLAGCGAGSATVTSNGPGATSGTNPGVVYLSASTYSVTQTAGALTITVNRAAGTDGTQTVSYNTANGTATAGVDYTAVSGTLTWAAGDGAAKQVQVPINHATMFSGSRTFDLALSASGGSATLSNPSSAVVTIVGGGTSGGAGGAVTLSASSYSVGQAAGQATLIVHRTGGSSGATTVDYATVAGTAIAGSQYTTTSGTLTWADGDASDRTVSVPLSNAVPFSGTKSFTVTLQNVTGSATLGTITSASVVISGSGGTAKPGAIALGASAYSVGQAAGSVNVTVNRTGGASGAVGISYATSDGTAIGGADYVSKTGTLSWADGDSTAKTVSIPVYNVAPFSGNKTFNVALSSATGGATIGTPPSATVTIVGSGGTSTAGAFSFSATSYSVGQAAGTVTISVNRAGGTIGATTVNYFTGDGSAKAGTDYTTASGTLKWADGDATAKTFTVAVSNVTAFAGTKSLTVTLASPTGGATLGTPSSASVVILGSGGTNTTGAFWVYTNGVFNWPGDYSFVSTINYADTTGVPLSGAYDIKWTVTGAWGGFQPYATNWSFDTTPYTYLRFAMKPTQPNQQAQVYFMLVGDIPVGITVNVLNYGPAPVVGKWAVYTIPLKDIGVANTNIYKFAIQDQTGLNSNTIYLDDIGFVPAN